MYGSSCSRASNSWSSITRHVSKSEVADPCAQFKAPKSESALVYRTHTHTRTHTQAYALGMSASDVLAQVDMYIRSIYCAQAGSITNHCCAIGRHIRHIGSRDTPKTSMNLLVRTRQHECIGLGPREKLHMPVFITIGHTGSRDTPKRSMTLSARTR